MNSNYGPQNSYYGYPNTHYAHAPQPRSPSTRRCRSPRRSPVRA